MTTEPAGSWATLTVAAAIAALGPTFGPFALLLFASVIGSVLAMGAKRRADGSDLTRWEGFVYVVEGAGLAVVLTGIAVLALERLTDLPGKVLLMPVAFALAAGREHILNGLKVVIDGAATGLAAIFNRRPGS